MSLLTQSPCKRLACKQLLKFVLFTIADQSDELTDGRWTSVVRHENEYFFEEKANNTDIAAASESISLSLQVSICRSFDDLPLRETRSPSRQMSDCLPSRSRGGSQCLFPTKAVIKDSAVVLLNQDVMMPAVDRNGLMLPGDVSLRQDVSHKS